MSNNVKEKKGTHVVGGNQGWERNPRIRLVVTDGDSAENFRQSKGVRWTRCSLPADRRNKNCPTFSMCRRPKQH